MNKCVVCLKECEDGGWCYLSYGDCYWVCSQEHNDYVHDYAKEFLWEFDTCGHYNGKYGMWIEFMGFKEWRERKQRMLVTTSGDTILGKLLNRIKKFNERFRCWTSY